MRRLSSRTRWTGPSVTPACRAASSGSWRTTTPRADRAQICWTLGITEHHNAADNVFVLINLSLLTGHVGRYGSGLVPLRGQNNVQGGGDMGAIPNKLTGFQDIETNSLPIRRA
jgi:predicted molibdopterin-dependent oxidoreductase YjgC